MKKEWEKIIRALNSSSNKISVETYDGKNEQVFAELGINQESVLGQVVCHISKLKINDYLSVLGGDENEKLNIGVFNREVRSVYPGRKLVVAVDIWGGLFAIGNGDFPGNENSIWYFAPDRLQWEDLDVNYTQFFSWVCSVHINKFYADFLCADIVTISKMLKEDEGILIYPFLWSNECNLKTAVKKPVPVVELVQINADYQNKMGLG